MTSYPTTSRPPSARDACTVPRPGGPPPLPTGVLVAVWTALAALTVAATVAVVVAGSSGPGPFAPDVPTAVDVAVGIAAVALVPLLWTRRSVPAALALAALAAVSGAATPAATTATLQVARWYPVRTAVAVAAAGVLGHAVQALWRPVSLPLGWWLLCDVAVHAALLGWGAYGQERSALLWTLRDRALRAEEEQERRVAEARAAERTRIAREMHDTLAHRLSLLAATAGALEFRPDAPPERLAEAAGRVRAGTSDALEDLRQVVRLLRATPDDLAPLPGLDDVARLVTESRTAGVDVEYVRRGSADPPGPVAVAAYRTAQEGLTNARRHAPGAHVSVVVESGQGRLQVVVADDGARPTAADPASTTASTSAATTAQSQGAGTGLVGLRERVDLLGGEVEAGPHDRGFALDVRLPWA